MTKTASIDKVSMHTVTQMTKAFEEIQSILPKNAFIIMVIILAATDAFILICCLIEPLNTPFWMFAGTSITFAAIILVCSLIKLRISIEDETIKIRYLKGYTIPFKEIIDHKTGEISVMRNYSGWGIKKVTFKNLISVGYDQGVSLKLTGRRVFTISLSEPERFTSLLPLPDETSNV